jgi:hypothetical protein
MMKRSSLSLAGVSVARHPDCPRRVPKERRTCERERVRDFTASSSSSTRREERQSWSGRVEM